MVGTVEKPGLNLLVDRAQKKMKRKARKGAQRQECVELNNIIESDVESVINNECDAPAFSVTQT